jgi:hypothetical protein
MIKRIWILLLISIWAVTAWGVSHPHHTNIGEKFLGEHLKYKVSLFPLANIAEADFYFQQDPGVKNGYVVTLHAKTMGIIKFLFFQKIEQVLVAHLITSPDGKRLISQSFVNKTVREDVVAREIRTDFDYDKKQVHWQVFKKGILKEQGVVAIPDNKYYDDPLCACYNLRGGAYGAFQKGRTIDVSTLPIKREKRIRLAIASEKQTQFRARPEREYARREYLVNVNTEEDIFESKKGNIEIWFSKDLVPVEATVWGVAFVGTVRGYLMDPENNIPAKTKSNP